MLITIKQKFNILNKLKRFSKSLQKQWTIKFIPRFYTGKVVARKKDFNIFFVIEGRSAVKIFGIKWRYYYCLKATLKIQILTSCSWEDASWRFKFCLHSRSSPSEVFLRKRVLKVYSKFTVENPCPIHTYALQLYWNHTSTWVLSCKFTVYFQKTFLYEHLWRGTSYIPILNPH